MKSRAEIYNKFCTHIHAGRVPHASLIVGNMGFGSLELGIKIAQTLLCLDKKEGKACGNCNACLRSQKFIHPDLHFSFPVVKKGDKKRADTTSKDFMIEWRDMLSNTMFFNQKLWAEKMDAGNRTPNINTKECNEIIQKLGLQAFEGGNKVLIIYLAEFLAREGNRLLKLIEEPPENTYIILVASSQEYMLNTILSRCQLIQMYPLADDEMKTALKDYDLSAEALRELTFMAKGDLIKARELAELKTENLSGEMLHWMRMSYMIDTKPGDLVEWIDNFAKLPSMNQTNFLDYMLHFLREYQLFLLTGNQKLRLSQEELASAEKMKRIIDLEKVDSLSQICDTLYSNLMRNANSKIELMNASIQLNTLMRKKLVLSNI